MSVPGPRERVLQGVTCGGSRARIFRRTRSLRGLVETPNVAQDNHQLN
jgi:hypothetical protein